VAVTIDLDQREARLLQLGVFYMLGHPRWQSDGATAGRRSELVAVYEQLGSASPEDQRLALRVEPDTLLLLDSALARVMPELKTYGMLTAAAAGKRGASTVEGFDEELARLFPATSEDPLALDDLLPHLMTLRRDFGRAAGVLRDDTADVDRGRQGAPAESAEDSGQGRKWQFWKR
jgi:hypothetical protein